MIDVTDRQLIAALQDGLPITPRPYADIARQIGLTEKDVIERLDKLKEQGLIKRLGVIVQHRKLGYHANAMVVLDVPEHQVEQLGKQIGRFSFVSLCYQRPRKGSQWPYNLYCMIHGKTREKVLSQFEQLQERCGLVHFNQEILFSRRCFKQRGAVYKLASQCDQWLVDGRH